MKSPRSLMKGRLPFLGRIKGYLSAYTDLNGGPVYFRRENFHNIVLLWDIGPLCVKEMDVTDEMQIMEWLKIINAAFNRNWHNKDFIENILTHKIYSIPHTYFLLDKNKYVGVVSEGVFKKNTQVGVTHYLGLDRSYLGRGLGKYLILYTLHKMREHGLESCEGESNLNHKESLFLHLDLGFKPKKVLDDWNTENYVAKYIQISTWKKYIRTFEEWEGSKK